MLAFWRRRSGRDAIDRLHATLVAASRRPELYGPGGFPDTTEGRFEALTLHAIAVFRRLRALPPPAEEVAQELADAVFAHLEIALRELGVGDFGVPKRMKKLARAFYDRAAKYEVLLPAADPEALAAEIAERLGLRPDELSAAAASVVELERRLARADLAAIMAGAPFKADGAGEARSELAGATR